MFLALFAMQLRARPLLPLNDPGLEKALTITSLSPLARQNDQQKNVGDSV